MSNKIFISKAKEKQIKKEEHQRSIKIKIKNKK